VDKLPLIARVLLGLIFFVFGLNGFFHFIPTPELLPERIESFMGALEETGYFLPLLSGVETLCGLLLLIGRFVPLALTVLAPVVVNIILFHLFLDPKGIVVGLVALVLGIYLAWSHRSSFRGVLAAKASSG
jgi:putative oxidoreductase